MTYGIMPPRDYKTFDDTLDLLCSTFTDGILNTLEIGVHKGLTSIGIRNYLLSKNRLNSHTAIDNQRDFKMNAPFDGCRFIIGDSKLVYSQIKDNSQHLLFIDGNHNYPSTIIDFLMYKSKVVENGFIMFHDCGRQIKPFTDFQGEGSPADPDMYISCRKAVHDLGLIDNMRNDFRLVSDESDMNHHTGGIVVVQKKSFSKGNLAYYLGAEQPELIEIDDNDILNISNGKRNLYSSFESMYL